MWGKKRERDARGDGDHARSMVHGTDGGDHATVERKGLARRPTRLIPWLYMALHVKSRNPDGVQRIGGMGEVLERWEKESDATVYAHCGV